MHFGRLQCLMLTAVLAGALGTSAHAGPLAVIANFTDPGTDQRPSVGWPPGSVAIVDTATDKEVGPRLTVGANPLAVAITPDGKTAVVACSQDSELDFVDLTASPPKVTDKIKVEDGQGDTFYPAGLAMDPQGAFVAVTSNTGGGSDKSTQIRYLKIVNMSDHSVNTVDLQSDLLLDENGKPFSGAAEAAAISPKGGILIVSPSTQNGEIFSLPYASGEINFPDTSENQMVGVSGHTGFNIALTPDGSVGILPLWNGQVDAVSIDDTGKLVITSDAAGGNLGIGPVVNAGGKGTHSVAISPDGKLAYVRNLLPPENITVFQIGAGPSLTPTGLTLNAGGFPQLLILAIPALASGNAGAFVGSTMVAVTPDGKKVYSANPYAGGSGLLDLGQGNVEVFQATSPAPIATLQTGSNPIAVAIQPK